MSVAMWELRAVDCGATLATHHVGGSFNKVRAYALFWGATVGARSVDIAEWHPFVVERVPDDGNTWGNQPEVVSHRDTVVIR